MFGLGHDLLDRLTPVFFAKDFNREIMVIPHFFQFLEEKDEWKHSSTRMQAMFIPLLLQWQIFSVIDVHEQQFISRD